MAGLETRDRPLSTYQWLAVAGAAVYLSLPIFVAFPSLYAAIARVPPLEGARLADFRSLMFVVSPIGFIYLFGVFRRETSLTDLTVLWRLAWVGPWVALNCLLGTLELGGALFIGSVDLLLPLAGLAIERGAVIERVRAHLKTPPPTPVHYAMLWEGRLGFVASLASGVYTAATQNAYVVSFVLGVLGCYYLFLLWAARSADTATMLFAVAIRLLLAGSLTAAISVGYVGPMLPSFLAVLVGCAVASGYSYAWHRLVRVEGRVSPTRWTVVSALALILVSLAWSTGGPWYGKTCSVLAVNIHRQDLIIGMFAALVGLLLADLKSTAPRHALGVSWFFPLAAVWFTSETKLLCHLGAGTPFHPSWTARGLAPVWSGNVVVDLSFSLATAALTIIGTTYTAGVLLRYGPRTGWRLVTWNGIAIMLVSAFWMIATSTGVPGLVPAMAGAALPPLLPGNVVSCVQVHVSDLVIGMFLIATGLLFEARQLGLTGLVPFVVGGAWVLTVLPKLFVNLGLM